MISLILKKKKNKQTKQTQISRIEETNILIENPKAQNKSKYLKETNILIENPQKKKKKIVLRCVRNNLSQFNWQRGLRIPEQNKRLINNFIKQIAY